jgi:hypothetical protein
LASRASAIADHHINRSFLGGNVSSAQRERPPADTPLGKNIRNAIERVTVSATRIEIVLCESIVGEGQDRLLTLPWTRTSSRRRHEIIQGVDELKQPQRAMRTKARDGFVKAFGAAHRWLDELLSDANTSLDSLAVREGKSERSIRMTLSLAFLSPVLAEAAMDGRLPRGFSIRRLTELPMLWSEQWTPWDFGNRFRRRPQSAADRLGDYPRTKFLLHSQPTRRLGSTLGLGLGNGILSAETGGRNQAQNARERSESGSQTVLRLANRRKLGGFLPTRKPPRFARTGWWAMQGSNLRPLPCEGSALPLS